MKKRYADRDHSMTIPELKEKKERLRLENEKLKQTIGLLKAREALKGGES